MTTDLDAFMSHYKEKLEAEMVTKIADLHAPPILKEAMTYSLQAGGKRIRPLLLFATIAACDQNPKIGLSAAASLEMIHTYSLIHDDLPSMDDDDLRRGKPTNHKVFGEAMAILAGDGLLTYSFQLIASDETLSEDKKVSLIKLLAKSGGPEGMVGGQVADIEGENKQLNIADLEYIHNHKTGKLLSYSILAGAIIGGAKEKQLNKLDHFAYHLGLSFQIRDDILDVVGDEDLLGKPVGSDTGKQKSTYPALLSLDGAKSHLAYHVEQAKKALQETGLNVQYLSQITDLIAVRTH